jgi:hypothetical protein
MAYPECMRTAAVPPVVQVLGACPVPVHGWPLVQYCMTWLFQPSSTRFPDCVEFTKDSPEARATAATLLNLDSNALPPGPVERKLFRLHAHDVTPIEICVDSSIGVGFVYGDATVLITLETCEAAVCTDGEIVGLSPLALSVLTVCLHAMKMLGGCTVEVVINCLPEHGGESVASMYRSICALHAEVVFWRYVETPAKNMAATLMIAGLRRASADFYRVRRIASLFTLRSTFPEYFLADGAHDMDRTYVELLRIIMESPVNSACVRAAIPRVLPL